MDGIPALDLWDLVVEVSHVPSDQPKTRSNLLRDKHCEKHSNARTKNSSTSQKILAGQMSLRHFTQNCLASVPCFAVIKMILKSQKSDDETRDPNLQSCAR